MICVLFELERDAVRPAGCSSPFFAGADGTPIDDVAGWDIENGLQAMS